MIMECPYCKCTMEEGYIENKRGPLMWTPNGHKRPLLCQNIATKSIDLGDTGEGALFGSTVTAFCCRKCKKVIIDI